MTDEIQSTPEASALRWPALRNHIPCMAHVIQFALGVFFSGASVKAKPRLWNPSSEISNLGSKKAQILGTVEDIERTAILE